MNYVKGKIYFSVYEGKKGEKVVEADKLTNLIVSGVKEETGNIVTERIKRSMSEAQKAAIREQRKSQRVGRKPVRAKMTLKREKKQQEPEDFFSLLNSVTTKPQQYLVIARLFYLIVCRTPIDERYKYTGYVDRDYRGKGKSRELVSVRAVTRTHVPDEEVLRNLWCISLRMKGRTTRGFLSVKDFNVNWEEEWGDGYKVIARQLRNYYKDGDISSVNIWNSYQPHDGFNKIMALEYGQYKHADTEERHVGEPLGREHGLIGGYSIQAPLGFIRCSWNDVENEADHIMNEYNDWEENKKQAKKNKLPYKEKKPSLKASNIKPSFGPFDFKELSDDNEIAGEVFEAIDQITKKSGVSIDTVTRREISRALAERRKSVPITLGELDTAALEKQLIENNKKDKDKAKKDLENYFRYQTKNLRKIRNIKYRMSHGIEANERRRINRITNNLAINISAGGETVQEGTIYLGRYGNKSYTVKGNLNFTKEQMMALLNHQPLSSYSIRTEKGLVDADIYYKQGTLYFDLSGDGDTKDNQDFFNLAEFIKSYYPSYTEKILDSIQERYSMHFRVKKSITNVLNKIIENIEKS